MSTNDNNLDKREILLLSNITNISNIIEIEQKKIIAFDYETHKILEKNNISHLLSDDFINEFDLLIIDKNSIKFSKWYNQTFLNDVLLYDGINLGELFGISFQPFLVSFLKKFIEIKNIFQLYPNTTFHASMPLFKILKLFTDNVTVVQESNNHINFFENLVSDSNNIHNNYLALNKKKLLLIFVSFLGFFFKRFTNNKPISNQKTILMINFTTKRNKQFLLNFPNFKMNFVKFDRNLPAIWNLDSFLTIRKSNCIIENYSSLIDNDIKNQISQTIFFIKKKTNLIFENNIFFNFFSLDGISFWPIIKDTLESFFQKNLFRLITEIYITKNLFKKYNFSNLLIWNESGINEKIAIHFAKRIGVNVSCLQHGLLYPTQPDLDNYFGSFPTLSDNFFVWGKINDEYFKNIRVTPIPSIKTGSPFYDGIDSVKNFSSDYILVAPAGLQNYTSFHQTISARLTYDNSLEQVCKIATKLKKKLIIKVHHGLSLNEENIIKKINPDIKVIKSGSIFELLKSCSILITLGPSTAILESLILKKPTICVPINAPNCNILFKNHEELIIPLSKLNETIESFFSNDDFHKKLLESGKSFLEDYLTNYRKASSTLLEFIENN